MILVSQFVDKAITSSIKSSLMLNNKIFVGSMDFKTTDKELFDFFSTFGKVTYAQILKDKMTNRSKGYGFVEFETEADAKNAVKHANGAELTGRPLFVDVARHKEEEFKRDSKVKNIQLLFPANEFNSEEISEILLLLHDLYKGLGGDELVTKQYKIITFRDKYMEGVA